MEPCNACIKAGITQKVCDACVVIRPTYNIYVLNEYNVKKKYSLYARGIHIALTFDSSRSSLRCAIVSMETIENMDEGMNEVFNKLSQFVSSLGRPTAHFTPYHKKVCSFDMKAGSPTRYTMSEVRRGTMKVFPCATRRVLLLYLLSASMVIGAAQHKGRFFVVAFPLSIDVTTKQAQFLSVANMEGASANVVITRPSIASEQVILPPVCRKP